MVGNIATVVYVAARDRLNSADPLLTSRHSFFLTSFRSSQYPVNQVLSSPNESPTKLNRANYCHLNICTFLTVSLLLLEYSITAPEPNQAPASSFIHLRLSQSLPQIHNLERVVLRCDLVLEEVANEWDLLQDVLLYFRDAVEEEQGEDTCNATEAACQGEAESKS